jgi:hypothetical protein
MQSTSACYECKAVIKFRVITGRIIVRFVRYSQLRIIALDVGIKLVLWRLMNA